MKRDEKTARKNAGGEGISVIGGIGRNIALTAAEGHEIRSGFTVKVPQRDRHRAAIRPERGAGKRIGDVGARRGRKNVVCDRCSPLGEIEDPDEAAVVPEDAGRAVGTIDGDAVLLDREIRFAHRVPKGDQEKL